MPDYSNTSIYHIREGEKVIYVGGTIDFRHRCRLMRLALSTPEHPEHHSLLIKYIREHGGILAFEVVEVHKGNYKDKEEYKQAVQDEKDKHEGLINKVFLRLTPEEKKQRQAEQTAASHVRNRVAINARKREQRDTDEWRAKMKAYREAHKEQRAAYYQENKHIILLIHMSRMSRVCHI